MASRRITRLATTALRSLAPPTTSAPALRAFSQGQIRGLEYRRFPQRGTQPPILTPFQKEVLRLPPQQQHQHQHQGGGGGRGWKQQGGPQTWDTRTKLAAVGAVGAGGYYVYHLERVPETGRLRFMDVSPASEVQMGLQAYAETLREYQSKLLPAGHPTVAYVERVAARIIEENGLGRMKGTSSHKKAPFWGGGIFGDTGIEIGPGGQQLPLKGSGSDPIEWEVFVIHDPKTKNAFVLPGGKIFVFTGILPVAANEDGLASVLGHEMAHQVARHSAERMSSLKVLMVLGFVLESLGLDIGISRLLLTFLLQLPNSRKSESEADFIGLRLTSKACFDPRESPKMWTRMSSSDTSNESSFGGVANLDFMSTHPANSKRIKALESWMPEALDVRAAASCGETARRFEDFREEIPVQQLRQGRRRSFGGEPMGGRW